MRRTARPKPDGAPIILEKPSPPAPGPNANRIHGVLRRYYVTYYTPLRGRSDDISKTRIALYRSRLDEHALAYAPEHTHFSIKKMTPQGGQRAA